MAETILIIDGADASGLTRGFGVAAELTAGALELHRCAELTPRSSRRIDRRRD
jgi:hypothetical protein